MHDFDAEQRRRQEQRTAEFGDHPFTLRGQTFHIRRIIPFGVLHALVSVTADDSTDLDAYGALYKCLLGMIATEEEREKFRALITDTESQFPVTYGDLLEVRNWMIQEASSLPPTVPASSSGSPSTSGSGETGTSSSEPAAA